MSKIRLDQLLVQQQLVESREQAQRLIRAGHVRIKEQTVSKPGHLFPEDSQIQLKEIERYVSRGGLKLEAAIQHFQLKLDGVIGLDIGSSTGGLPTACFNTAQALFMRSIVEPINCMTACATTSE